MKAKSALVRKMRSDRLWSQEQLAEACGLSLRTIQRLETSGNVSIETIRALASVLEINPDDLVWRDGGFEAYRHVQRSDYILLALFLIGSLVLAIQGESGVISPVVMGVVFGTLVILTVLFYSLTIEVNENYITWYFGPGFWRKMILLEEIGECRSVQNPFWWGFGIRNFGVGWLYNVSGLLAVELCLNSGAKIRLGTDEPRYLEMAIKDAQSNAL